MKQQRLIMVSILTISFSIGCSSSDFAASSEKRSNTQKKDLVASGDDAIDGEDGSESGGQEDGIDSSDSDVREDDDNEEADDGKEDGSREEKEDDDDVKIDEGAANICDNPSGNERSVITIGGEDVPGNGLVGGPDAGKPLGSDFDDYKLEFAGKLTREGATPTAGRIGMKKKGNVTLNYSRGTTACSHDFEVVIRRCPNKDAKELARYKLSIGSSNSGSTSFKVAHDNVYLDIVMTVSGSSRHDFGGCALPFPLTNKLYGNAMPGFIL